MNHENYGFAQETSQSQDQQTQTAQEAPHASAQETHLAEVSCLAFILPQLSLRRCVAVLDCLSGAARWVAWSVSFRWLTLGVGFALLLATGIGCKTASPIPRSEAVPRTESSETVAVERVARAHAHYAAGILCRLNDDPEGALEQFAQAALLDPSNEMLVLEVAQQYVQRDQPWKALQVLTNAVAGGAASGELFTQLGSTYARLGKTELAEKAYCKALAKAPDSILPQRNLFMLLVRQKRFAQAGRLLDAALARPSASAEFLVELAELYVTYAQQHPPAAKAARTGALTALDRAMGLKPINPHLQLKIADGFAALDKPSKALPVYTNVFAFYREFPGLRNSVRAKIAEQYLRLGDRRNAIEQIEEIVRDQPANPLGYYWLGTIALAENEPGVAAAHFARAVLFGPDFEQAYYELARAQLGANQPEAALETLEKARARFGDKFAVEYLSGVAYAQQKDYVRAIQHYAAAERLALAADPDRTNAPLYFHLGAAYERTGQIDQAVQCFRKALGAEPDFAEALNYLGYLWAERGQNLREARRLIERAVKLDPTNAAYLDSLGWVLFKQNRPRQALKYILRAVELSEKPDPVVFDHLGEIYIRLGQREKALDAWRKSLELEHNPEVEAKLLRHCAYEGQ